MEKFTFSVDKWQNIYLKSIKLEIISEEGLLGSTKTCMLVGIIAVSNQPHTVMCEHLSTCHQHKSDISIFRLPNTT